MLSFIIRIIGNAVALYVAHYLVPGFLVPVGPLYYFGGLTISAVTLHYLEAGLVLALLNLIVKPILKFISFPIILLTLGLFTFVINILIMWLLSQLVVFIIFESLFALIMTVIIVSIVNLPFSIIAKNS